MFVGVILFVIVWLKPNFFNVFYFEHFVVRFLSISILVGFCIGVLSLDKYVGSLDDCLLLGLHFAMSSLLGFLCEALLLLSDRGSFTLTHWNFVSLCSLILLIASILIFLLDAHIFSNVSLIRLVCPQLYVYTSIRCIVSNILFVGGIFDINFIGGLLFILFVSDDVFFIFSPKSSSSSELYSESSASDSNSD